VDAIARLVAIEDIKQLKARYFRFMDTRDWAAMATVFCRDAHFDCTEGSRLQSLDGEWRGRVGPVTVGREAIMAWISGSFENVVSVHHGHCHEITLDSATEAHGVIAMEDYIRTADRRQNLVHGLGHYHERYRIEEGAWRIARTKLTRLLSDEFGGGLKPHDAAPALQD
jgi:SnoaL-like domain